MMDCIVRRAIASDAEQLSALSYAFNGEALPADEIEAALTRGNEIVAAAEIAGRLAGFGCAQIYRSFCYRSAQGEITELYVAPEYRGQGIAGRLFSFLESELSKRNVREIKVLTGQGNTTALRAYEASGYERAKHVVLYKRLQPSTASDLPTDQADPRSIQFARYIQSLPDFEYVEEDSYYDHMRAIIVDGILQAGINYDRVVRPRAERIAREHPEAATTDGFAELLGRISAEELLDFRGEKIKRVQDVVRFLQQENVQTREDLRRFLSDDSNRRRFTKIKGVGEKTRDYFCLLAGIPTAAVDRHLIHFLQQAGIEPKGYADAIAVIHGAADLLGVSRTVLDYSIWSRMARS